MCANVDEEIGQTKMWMDGWDGWNGWFVGSLVGQLDDVLYSNLTKQVKNICTAVAVRTTTTTTILIATATTTTTTIAMRIFASYKGSIMDFLALNEPPQYHQQQQQQQQQQ